MGNSRLPGSVALEPLPGPWAPDRSRGALGINDAADPNQNWVMVGNTPGPLGFGGDGADDDTPRELQLGHRKISVMEVDLEQVERFLQSVAMVLSLNLHTKLRYRTTRTFYKGDPIESKVLEDIDTGNPQDVKNEATRQKQKLLAGFMSIMDQGPKAIVSYLKLCQSRKDKAKQEIDAKFAQVRAVNEEKVQALGAVIKTLAVVEFASTCFIKIASTVTGTGAVVDIAYDTTQAGVDAYFAKPNADPDAVVVRTSGSPKSANQGPSIGPMPAKSGKSKPQDKDVAVIGGMVGKAAEETGKEVAENAWEAGVKKMAGKAGGGGQAYEELKDLKNLPKDLNKLRKQARSIEQKLEGQNLAKKPTGRYQKRLNQKLVKNAERQMGTLKSAGKTVASKGLSILFLKNDLQEAWGRLEKNWNDSN